MMKTRSSAEMRMRSSAQMKKMSVECEVVECNFKTPTLDVEEYAAMVRHLQVLGVETLSQKLEEIISIQIQLHTKLIHGVEVAGEGGCSCQNKKKAGSGKTLPPSRFSVNLVILSSLFNLHWIVSCSAKPRSLTRSRSRRRSNVEELDFPCPDCNLQSFATEAGLYIHRLVAGFM